MYGRPITRYVRENCHYCQNIWHTAISCDSTFRALIHQCISCVSRYLTYSMHALHLADTLYLYHSCVSLQRMFSSLKLIDGQQFRNMQHHCISADKLYQFCIIVEHKVC
uniref:Uncharacterized protein n=1 Tax=Cacopsylla melanoneura TaxID=428564 RepID=A0A8D9BZA7_9HEMI